MFWLTGLLRGKSKWEHTDITKSLTIFLIIIFQPMEVYVDDEAKLTLHGLQQHYVKLKDQEKNRKLFELLDVLEFNQVVIFVKSVQRCMALAQLLIEQNFPAIAIHRSMPQEERLSRYQQFKDFQKVNKAILTYLNFQVTIS